MKATSLAVRKRIASSVIAFALVVLGAYGLLSLPVNFLPDMTYPMIKVNIWWRGAAPEEIDTNIADPVERIMATVDGLDYLESSSIEGMYSLTANFKYSVDLNTAYQDALAAMARVARQLPKDIDPPIIFKADPTQLPVVQLTIRSEEKDLVEIRSWVENWLQKQLLSVAGVAGTEIVGGLKREIRVHLDPGAMEKYSLSLQTVLKRMQEENIDQFAGRITAGPREIIARTSGEYRSLEEIRTVVLARKGDAKITLEDIAEVVDSHEQVRVITRLGGRPCVKLSILKQADANTVEVADAVNNKIEELRPSLPAGIELGVVENQADYVLPALRGVRNAAIEAAILVLIVVYLFLGSLRQVLVMLLALPITLVLNFAIMKLAGFSLNIFSLGGLVVAIGVVLDNSIVVIENITRLRHESLTGSTEEIAIEGTNQVGPAILAATLSFIALFVPFLLVPGLTSLLFKELILVIAGIVSVSLIIAVTLTPMLTAILLKGNGNAGPRKTLFEKFFDKVTSLYGRSLSWTMRERWLTFSFFIMALIIAVALAPRLGSEFLPQMDDGRIMIKAKLPTGASLNETDSVLRQIEAQLINDPIIESYFTLSGGKVLGLYTYEIANEGEVDIQLVPRHSRKISTKDYIKTLRPKAVAVSVPGGKVIVTQAKVKGMRKIGEADIEIKIKGQNLGTLFSIANDYARLMSGLKQFANVYVTMDMNKPEYQIRVDRTRAAEMGVSVSDVANTARSFLNGAVATRYKQGDDFYNIRLMIAESRVTSRSDVEGLLVNTSQGGYLRLRDVADVTEASGPVEISREDQVKAVVVRGDAAGTSVGEALASLKRTIEGTPIPTGYQISFGGQAQMMAEMTQTVKIILAFALFFSFVVLAVQFNNLRLPAIILGCLPFCAAGMIYALYLSQLPVGATVLIGLLVVAAAMVNGGVLLLVLAEELRQSEGLTPFEAVLKAAKIRLRPRVMIAVAVIVGFIPLALNLEEGGDMLQPMAVGAIGGLLLGIMVALFLMPCLYLIFSRRTS